MSNDVINTILDGILENHPVSYRVEFCKCYGSVNAGLLLSQLVYWSNKGADKNWIYKTQKDLFNELGMTRYEQEAARWKLKENEVIEEKLKGSPPKLHFKINLEKIKKDLQEYYSNCGNSTYSNKSGKTTNQIVKKPQIKKRKSSISSTTEITKQRLQSESTKKIINTSNNITKDQEDNKEINTKSFANKSSTGSIKESKGQSRIQQLETKESPNTFVKEDVQEEIKRPQKKKSRTQIKKPPLEITAEMQEFFDEMSAAIIKCAPQYTGSKSLASIKSGTDKAIQKALEYDIDHVDYIDWFLNTKRYVFKAWPYLFFEKFLDEYDLYIRNKKAKAPKKMTTEEMAASWNS